MAVLTIDELTARVRGTDILKGVSLQIRSGEVDVLMGPNGSGKSTLAHVLMGNPAYEVTGGSVTFDDHDVLSLDPAERAQLGLFAALQYPNELPGVTLTELMTTVYQERGWDSADIDSAVRSEAAAVNLRGDLLDRSVNVGFSGGEKKRAETVQLVLSRPRIAILDEGLIVAEDTPEGLKDLVRDHHDAPTLEDVFMELTGKELVEKDAFDLETAQAEAFGEKRSTQELEAEIAA